MKVIGVRTWSRQTRGGSFRRLVLVLACCLAVAAGLIFCIRYVDIRLGLYRDALTQAKRRIDIHRSLAIGHYDKALEKIAGIEADPPSRIDGLALLFIAVATSNTTASLSGRHVGRLPDDEVLQALHWLVGGTDDRTSLSINSMRCQAVTDDLLSSPLAREKALVMCAFYPYRKSREITYLRGLYDQLTTPTWNWLPLAARATILNANHEYAQALALLNDESFRQASNSDRRVLKYQLMIALVMTDETTRAQAIAREIVSEPVQDVFREDAAYVLQRTLGNSTGQQQQTSP